MSAFARKVLSSITRDHEFFIDPEHGSLERGPKKPTFEGSLPKRPGAARLGMRSLWIGCIAAILAMFAARGGTPDTVRNGAQYGAMGLGAVAAANVAAAVARARNRQLARVAAIAGDRDGEPAAQGKAIAALRDGGFAGPAWLVAPNIPAEIRARAQALDVRCFEVVDDALKELPPA